jgi:hypothetical protein
MKFKVMTTIAALAVMTAAASLLAFDGKNGVLHLVKDCTNQHGNPGDYCVITFSNVPQIPVGSKLFYDQAAGIPAGFLDSNVLLHVGSLDWAVGRCTFDFSVNSALCTFSDGVGPLAGFRARTKVTSLGGVNYAVDGPYSLGVQNEQ